MFQNQLYWKKGVGSFKKIYYKDVINNKIQGDELNYTFYLILEQIEDGIRSLVYMQMNKIH